MEGFFSLLYKRLFLRKRNQDIPLIIVGIGYNSHVVSKAMNSTASHRVIALIDEEPWNHLNLINGAVVHYPGELVAMVKRYKVKAVILFEEDGLLLNDQDSELIKAMGTAVIQVPEAIKLDQKAKYICTRIPLRT
ncbi:MAG: nucleoside-diphosphate sugar epimerase/dehydratase [Neptuniibacter sp.]